ncbi:hypothetical protein ACHAXS_004811 [Conticribra weissflogii]
MAVISIFLFHYINKKIIVKLRTSARFAASLLHLGTLT